MANLTTVNGRPLVSARLTEADLVDAAISTLERSTVLRAPQAKEAAEMLESIGGRPLADRILVLPLPPDERHGKIFIPETARQDQTCGIVVAVGVGRYQNGVLVPPEVKPGNFVMFSRFSSRSLKIGDIEVFQIVEADITFAAGR